MSRHWGQPAGVDFLSMSPSFMPSSELQDHAQLRMIPNRAFRNSIQPAQLPVPQTVAAITQPSPNMSQQGQKRNFSDVEYVDNTLPMMQHHDPIFYGLSTSLPMSTYTTPTCLPPPQTPNSRLRQDIHDAQGGHTPMQHRPQASAYYSNRSVASARPSPVYSSPRTHSRRGYRSNELYRARHLRRQPTSNIRSPPSTKPYMSDCPPSWDWINQLHTLDATVDMPRQQDHNFTFTWPALNDEFEAVNHVQNMQQGSKKVRHPSMQSSFSDLAANTAIPYSTSEQCSAHQRLQITPGTMINSFSHVSAPLEEISAVDGSFGSQVTLKPWAGQGKQPLQSEKMHWDHMHAGFTSVTGHSLSDVPHKSDFDAFPFESLNNFDHDFGFDFDLSENLAEGDTPSNSKAAFSIVGSS